MNIESGMRLFIAVDMPNKVIEHAQNVQRILQETKLFNGPYTNTSGMHITLKFLGETLPASIPVIDDVLKVVEGEPMVARLGAVDCFKHGEHLKVIYQHILCPELESLAKSIDERLTVYYIPEERPFTAHLTLARVKQVTNREKLLSIINTMNIPKLEFVLDRFVLKQSELTPEGPVYKDIKEYLL